MTTVKQSIISLLHRALEADANCDSKSVVLCESFQALKKHDDERESGSFPQTVIVLMDENDTKDSDLGTQLLCDHFGCIIPVVLGHKGTMNSCLETFKTALASAKPLLMPLSVIPPPEGTKDSFSWSLGDDVPIRNLPKEIPYIVVQNQDNLMGFYYSLKSRAESSGLPTPVIVVLSDVDDVDNADHEWRETVDGILDGLDYYFEEDDLLRVKEPLTLAQRLNLIRNAECYVVRDSSADISFNTFAAMSSAEKGTAVICQSGIGNANINGGSGIIVTDEIVDSTFDALAESQKESSSELKKRRRERMDAALSYVRREQCYSAQNNAVAAICERVRAVQDKLLFASSEIGKQCYDYSAVRGKNCLGIDKLVFESFSRTLKEDVTYLDNVGSALYSEEQIRQANAMLLEDVLANPHSSTSTVDGLDHNPAIRTSKAVRAARTETLNFFHTSCAEHTVVFTSGCTAALKLVGECFAWSKDSVLCYLHDNHNSALGVREYALASGVPVESIRTFDDASVFLTYAREVLKTAPQAQHLLVLPLQSNFDGSKHDTSVISELRKMQTDEDGNLSNSGFRVLLDAAAWVPHCPLDLHSVEADFTCISYYKIFGYPTGIGALILRNDTALLSLSKKTYFGGGTVSVSLQETCHHVLRDTLAERFEDGTVSFLSIASLHFGFEALRKLGGDSVSAADVMPSIDKHVALLTYHLAHRLQSLRHGNGKPVVKLAGCAGGDLLRDATPSMDVLEKYMHAQGPVIAFNVMKSDGIWIGPSTVGTLATLSGIQLRTGCTCNPRGCQRFLGLSDAAVLKNAEAGRVCWADDLDVVDGVPTGAVRVSIGYNTRFEDVERMVSFISEQFVDKHRPDDVFPPAPAQALSASVASAVAETKRIPLTVSGIFFYPIKGCNGCSVNSWEIGSNGALLHDREWAVVDEAGRTIQMKQQPRLCFVTPEIDANSRTVIIHARDMPDISIPLPDIFEEDEKEEEKTDDKDSGSSVLMCGLRKRISQRPSDAADLARVSAWFTKLLGIPCSFVQASHTGSNNGSGVKGSFLNSANFLLCTEASYDDLCARLPAEDRDGVDLASFRSNIVIRGNSEPYIEDRWKTVQIGPHILTSVRLCDRCLTTCVDKRTATISREPLHTLAKYRHFQVRPNGPVRHTGLMFGHLMNRVASSTGKPWTLSVGARVVPLELFPEDTIACVPKSDGAACSLPSSK